MISSTLKIPTLLFIFLQFVFFDCIADSFSYDEEKNYQCSYMEDRSNSYTISEVLQKDSFVALPKHSLSLNFIPYTAWMKIDLAKTSEDRLLVIENAHLDEIDLHYIIDGQLVRVDSSGDLRPFSRRTLNYNFFNYLIPKNTTQIVIRCKNKGLMFIPAKVFTPASFFHFYQSYTFIHWFYFGFLILAICSNLLFYFWLKESIYFYYVMCVCAIGFTTAVDFGYTFQLFWPDSPSINQFNSTFYCSAFFIILFTEKILNIKINAPKLYRLYQVLYGTVLTGTFISLLGFYEISIKIIFYLVLIMPLISIYSGISILIKTKSEAPKFFLIGWTGYFICMLVYFAALSDVISYNIFTTNAMQLGSIVEILFLNLAILSKINSLKKEKEMILAEQNKILEERVKERTLELHEKTDEVIAQNEELQHQQSELEAQRDTLEQQNKIIEEQNLLLKGSKETLEKLVEKRTKQLKHTNDELTEYNNRLEQFAFITAHNLRGPVSTLLGLSQIYNTKDAADPINLVILEKYTETTVKLDEIIKDLVEILDLQKNVSNLTQSMPLLPILKDSQILLFKEIENSNALIHHNFNEESTLDCVPAYLNNIFYNLLSNAIKYSRSGIRPKISIECIHKPEKTILRFTDNGRGIDLERFKEKLFKPYKRFHLDKAGKGLGLYIVKTQVEIMKGTVEIESEEEKGTCISITLPNKKD